MEFSCSTVFIHLYLMWKILDISNWIDLSKIRKVMLIVFCYPCPHNKIKLSNILKINKLSF